VALFLEYTLGAVVHRALASRRRDDAAMTSRRADLDEFIRRWRSAFGETLTRRQARTQVRREARFYADLNRLASPPASSRSKPAADAPADPVA